MQSIENPNPGRIYNVCDNEAASPADVTAYACKLLGVPVPVPVPYEVAAKDMSHMALSFWQDNRRIDNTRIKLELGVKLNYPTYRDGLKSLFDSLPKA
jgi:nucleoside-diphosphate-sugar epimerase